MKKYLITTLAVFIALTSTFAQESVIFKVKISPNKKYKISQKIFSEMKYDFSPLKDSTNDSSDTPIMPSMKNSNVQEIPMVIQTYDTDQNGKIPAIISFQDGTATYAVNNQVRTMKFPLSGAKFIGKYDSESKFKIDSVQGDSTQKAIMSQSELLMKSLQNVVLFPEKPMKVGESFISNTQMDVPYKNVVSINSKIKTEYTLNKIIGNEAYFSFKQIYDMTTPVEGIHTTLEGSGSGTFTFLIQEGYILDFRSLITMKMISKTDGGPQMTIETSNTTEQQTVIE